MSEKKPPLTQVDELLMLLEERTADRDIVFSELRERKDEMKGIADKFKKAIESALQESGLDEKLKVKILPILGGSHEVSTLVTEKFTARFSDPTIQNYPGFQKMEIFSESMLEMYPPLKGILWSRDLPDFGSDDEKLEKYLISLEADKTKNLKEAKYITEILDRDYDKDEFIKVLSLDAIRTINTIALRTGINLDK